MKASRPQLKNYGPDTRIAMRVQVKFFKIRTNSFWFILRSFVIAYILVFCDKQTTAK